MKLFVDQKKSKLNCHSESFMVICRPHHHQGVGEYHSINRLVHAIIQVFHISSLHYNDAIMGTMASQITSLTIVYSTVYSDADQRKHQSSASLAFVRGIHRGPVNSPHKWPVTRFHLMTPSWQSVTLN